MNYEAVQMWPWWAWALNYLGVGGICSVIFSCIFYHEPDEDSLRVGILAVVLIWPIVLVGVVVFLLYWFITGLILNIAKMIRNLLGR